MRMLDEFKAFALRGNVIDLAVGVIVGAAFGKIIDSLVGDIIMPVLSLVVGKIDFSNLFVVLGHNPNSIASIAELKKAGIPVLAYGNFITVAVNFILLAFVIFLLVRLVARLHRQEPPLEPAAPPPVPEDIQLLREIRDSLKK
ncbi:MAG: large conductance mechanosensitive channel protein MscL [Candidatus Protistobacter heckmanni]|nr:large conductance mechanosensitive channel protein MscL [Candidatus Protistobacter heckmanni]